MKSITDEYLNSVLEGLDRFEFIQPEDIPNIDLYMDQVTTFIDRKMRASARYPDVDKILTKTMINNYAKNDLLPPPVKKKYSKEHVLLLIFIYYYKGLLSISDIQTLLNPLTDKYFQNGKDFRLEDVYKEIFSIAQEEKEILIEDVRKKFARAKESFSNAPEEDCAFLQNFAFICQMSFDVYMKKLMIEKMIDQMVEKSTTGGKSEKKGKTEKVGAEK